MNNLEFPIERLNQFLDNHTFEVFTQPTHDENHSVKTDVKVKITGVKNYISVGDDKPHVEYTLTILPTNEESDMWNKMWGRLYGKELDINTSSQEYHSIRWVMNHKLSDFLQYFGINKPAICTKVINEDVPSKMNESLIVEGQLDKTTRTLVQDIIRFFKHQREGEFGLPEDTSNGEMVYELPGFNNFSIFLDLQLSDEVETVDVDGDLYYDDDILYITIISNPNSGYAILDELTKELNEVIRHELEHIRQYEKGYEFPKKEPKSPEKYYTQPHELEAQRAGFRKRAKSEKADFETLVRDWFKKNPHKHNLKPEQQEKVIQQIIQK
jgi:hypothetical protein